MRPPRYVPGKAFPPYAFVPGSNPHPTSDPAGHSHGLARRTPPPLEPDRWHLSEDYLWGLDLFNAGFYWEAHEAWEGLWHAAGRRGETADFLKALIKLAAAGVKAREGKAAGVLSHARRAADLCRGVGRSLGEAPVFLGLRIAELVELAEAVCRGGWPGTPPGLLPTRPEF